MAETTATDFLTFIETALEAGDITKSDYKILVRDMSTILDNAFGDDLLSLRHTNRLMVIELSCYKRMYDQGTLSSESWYGGDNTRNDNDEPIMRNYYSDGSLEQEVWKRDGLEFRNDDKPTFVSYYKNGQIMEETWNRRHSRYRNHPDYSRVRGVFYDEDGTVRSGR